uniref:Uncharacterized protein n=1 Tax=Meloidogyne incognita TaxID=6306 RepID=A0A914LB47_MELIC
MTIPIDDKFYFDDQTSQQVLPAFQRRNLNFPHVSSQYQSPNPRPNFQQNLGASSSSAPIPRFPIPRFNVQHRPQSFIPIATRPAAGVRPPTQVITIPYVTLNPKFHDNTLNPFKSPISL